MKPAGGGASDGGYYQQQRGRGPRRRAATSHAVSGHGESSPAGGKQAAMPGGSGRCAESAGGDGIVLI